MRFTCRLQSPEVAQGSGEPCLAKKSVALHFGIGTFAPGGAHWLRLHPCLHPSAASLPPSVNCSGSGWIRSPSAREGHLWGEGFQEHLSAPASDKGEHG